jgi:hypothetical protein
MYSILLFVLNSLFLNAADLKEDCMKQITIFHENGSYDHLPLLEALCEYKSGLSQKPSFFSGGNSFKRSIKLYSNSYNQKTHSPCTRIEKLDQHTINNVLNGDFYHIEFAGLQYIFLGNDASSNACRHFLAKMYKKAGLDVEQNMKNVASISPKCFKQYDFLHVKAPLLYLVYRNYVSKQSNTKSSLIYNAHPDYCSNTSIGVYIDWLAKDAGNNNHQWQFSKSNKLHLSELAKGNFETTMTHAVSHYKDTGNRLAIINCKLFIGENIKDLVPLYYAQQLLDSVPEMGKIE